MIDDGPTLAELADEIRAENARLISMVQAAQRDPAAAEAMKWRAAYDAALPAQSAAMDTAAQAHQREQFTKAQLMRCGRAVGEDDPRKIAAAVEAALRKKAA